ncbi:MAG: hydrogenase small subunit [Rhodocyclaceae bacterium]|nr:hydrogenase small subunit [Rhodocyclaceae bacterium]
MKRPAANNIGGALSDAGISRRDFLGFCATLAAAYALPTFSVGAIAAALEKASRASVIWLSFQECTGCTESLTRSHTPTIEGLILEQISLDYHHTLQAASGAAAEQARDDAMRANAGKYLLIVDGSVPLGNPGYSTIAGVSNVDMLREAAKGAAAIIAVGTCAAYGGVAAAQPNPTGAVPVSQVIQDKPVVNVPGCPPIPVVITGVLAHFLTFGSLPELDDLGRPKIFYGESIHDRCYRRPFYDQGKFAENFDDEGARKGWCLFKLGCKGPVTYNACATTKWNNGVSFPIQSGHGCLGCSQPGFWDAGPFYKALSMPTTNAQKAAGIAAAAGVAAGAAMAYANRRKKAAAKAAHAPVKVEDLVQEKKP